jgi:hypothetical protein
MARPIPAEGEALLGKQAKYKRGLKARSIIRSNRRWQAECRKASAIAHGTATGR